MFKRTQQSRGVAHQTRQKHKKPTRDKAPPSVLTEDEPIPVIGGQSNTHASLFCEAKHMTGQTLKQRSDHRTLVCATQPRPVSKLFPTDISEMALHFMTSTSLTVMWSQGMFICSLTTSSTSSLVFVVQHGTLSMVFYTCVSLQI